jgi:hypothetical protein
MEPDFLTEYERAEHYKRLYQSRGMLLIFFLIAGIAIGFGPAKWWI